MHHDSWVKRWGVIAAGFAVCLSLPAQASRSYDPQRESTPVEIQSSTFNGDGGANWFAGKGSIAELPSGITTLGGISFSISSTNTPGAPDVIMLSSSEKSRVDNLTVNRTAHAVVFLHTFDPGPAIETWKQAVSDSLGRSDTTLEYPEHFPPEPPLLGRYIIHYNDGDSVSVGIRFGESVHSWLRTGEFLPPPFADTLWTRKLHDRYVYADGFPRRGEQVALYGFYYYNPKPAKTIASISLVAAEDGNVGTLAVVAVSTVNETPAPKLFYASPEGRPDAAGTFEDPWDLPDMGWSKDKKLPGGGKLFFRGGTYATTGFMHLRGSSDPDSAKLFSGYPGETAVVDAVGFIASGEYPGAIHIKNSYVCLQNLWLKNSRSSGVHSGSANIIRNMTILKTYGPGIRVGDSAKVLGNTIIRACCRQMGTDSAGNLVETGKNPREQIEMGGSSYIETAFNEVCWGDKEGIDINYGHHNRVHHNHLHHYYRKPWINGISVGSTDGGQPVSDVIIRNNLTYDNTWSGISVGGYGRNIKVINNTSYRNKHNGITLGSEKHTEDSLTMTNVTIRNNISSFNGRLQLVYPVNRDDFGHIVEYNLVQYPPEELRQTKWVATKDTLLGDHGVETDPLFVNTSIRDLRLKGESPAIDDGHPDDAYNDPDGSRNDKGAFFAGGVTPVKPRPRGVTPVGRETISIYTTKDRLVVANSGEMQYDLTVFGLNGRLVRTCRIAARRTAPIEFKAAGMLLLHIEHEGRTVLSKKFCRMP